MEREIFSVESRYLAPGAIWLPVHDPQRDNREWMTEGDADALIEKYRRAMPTCEYRKKSRWINPVMAFDDIPF